MHAHAYRPAHGGYPRRPIQALPGPLLGARITSAVIASLKYEWGELQNIRPGAVQQVRDFCLSEARPARRDESAAPPGPQDAA